MAERMRPDDAHRALGQHIHAWRDFSSYEQGFAGTVVPDFTEVAKTIDSMGASLGNICSRRPSIVE